MLLLKATGVWLLMVVVAIANGILREFVLEDYLSHNIALPLSGIILSILIWAISFVFIGFIKGGSAAEYIWIGVFWATLTLILEYALGFTQGLSFSEISRVFNVLEGNLFSLALLVNLLSPITIALLKGYVVN